MPGKTREPIVPILLTGIFVAVALQVAALGGPDGEVQPPANVPPARAPTWQDLAKRVDAAEVGLGSGHLAPPGPPPDAGTSWVKELLLPVYESPGGDHSGWLANGWWMPASNGDPVELTADAMVETGYAVASFVVDTINEEDWFRLRFSVAAEPEHRTAWVSEGSLGLGSEKLVLTLWRDELMSHSPLFFRNQDAPHQLLEAPSPGAAQVTLIEKNHGLDPLEVRGDWMRVRVHQPSMDCVPAASWSGRVQEGWIRWTVPEEGPRVWYYTRGC